MLQHSHPSMPNFVGKLQSRGFWQVAKSCGSRLACHVMLQTRTAKSSESRDWSLRPLTVKGGLRSSGWLESFNLSKRKQDFRRLSRSPGQAGCFGNRMLLLPARTTKLLGSAWHLGFQKTSSQPLRHKTTAARPPRLICRMGKAGSY